eukprot:CAMPEP_0201693404 /NCGR_PEP_ID=MMETSP0578-20130828/6017_1 /ASSEMBLY_ACC=CAM_ASM_000663 /TAXON_ID=267565 /ORGANISM="Skeletonema grethea, Strain CCMP 1804" /LENGTH=731 /DNA_ID=CAMNT_0048178931 /DNA_START=32 /DNA_END=2224 /DNA_ORIENTATION=-
MACVECRKVKVACVKPVGSDRCHRCYKRSLPCTPHTSLQGRRTDLIKHESLTPQRIQRSSPLGHIESPGDTSDVNVQQENELEVLDDVFCQGKRGLWSIRNDNSLEYQVITSRMALDKEGISRYLICTCVNNLPQGCSGCFSVFRRQKSNSWHLAIVESFFYLNHDGTDKIHLFRWTGKLAAIGSPAFYTARSWDEMSTHFQREIFHLDEIDFFFINKVSGITFPNETISDDTRSTNDGGIQCSPFGPDQLPYMVPVQRSTNMNLNLSSLPTSPTNLPFFEKNKLKYTLRQRTRTKVKDLKKRKDPPTPQQSDLSKLWSKPTPRLPPQESTLCAIFLTHSDGTSLEPDDLQMEDDTSNLFFFPSPLSSSGCREFYGISPDDYGAVLRQINGISREEAKDVLMHYSKAEHILFDSSSFTTGHSYTKIFVDDAPSLTISSIGNTTTHHTPRRKVICQIVPSRTCYEMIPLSASVVDPNLHGHKVTPSIIQRIVVALGKNGLFTIRNRSAHKNFLSFLGQRSEYTVAQPNPSEGDVSSFWYYRQHINHCFWPLALKVVNNLTHGIKIFPQFEFFHLTVLLPYLMPDLGSRGDLNFCLFAILTINFVNCIHTDIRDKMHESVAQDAIVALRALLQCKVLSAAKRRQVSSSLHHVERYGISTPTTCGYQIVRENEEESVEVLQFFCCYGLGTCYQVQHYWVHTFLPALFSHYTSGALYVSKDKVYAEYEGIDVLAW